jgi:hypothetical protein
MRILLMGLISVVLQTAAQAQDKPPAPDKQPDACFYTLVTGEVINVAVGKNVCRRSPAPYESEYSLLKCGPPLDEVVASLHRGDPRCDKFEDRP